MPGRASRPIAAELREGFLGPDTVRRALEHSRNVPTIRLMDALGPKQVIAYARRFGLTAPLPPYLPSRSAPAKRR